MNMLRTFIATILIVSGCTWHQDVWSTVDSRLQEMLDPQNENSKDVFIAQWGKPLRSIKFMITDRFGNPAGEEDRLLWLWETDGSGLSTQPEQGWEVFLRFNKKGTYTGWERGAYRTPLTLADVMTAVRKVGHVDRSALVRELGLGVSPRGASTEGNQKKIFTIAKVVHLLDLAAKAVHQIDPDQPDLATEADIVKHLIANRLYHIDASEKNSHAGKFLATSPKHSIPLSSLGPISPSIHDFENDSDARRSSQTPLIVPAPNF